MTDENQKKIAIIEDDAITLDLLQRKFIKAGYSAKAARDGVSGLQLIKEFGPDLVLLDIVLPRVDGFGVLEKLVAEKILPALPVIIISNSGQPVEIKRALEMGAKDYLVKVNFNPNEVLEKVKKVLG